MRIARYDDNRFGLVDGDEVIDVTSALSALPAQSYPFPRTDLLIENWDKLRPSLEAAAKSGARKKLSDVKLLAPIANPGKIVAAPVNYKKHLDEARADAGIHHQQ